MATVTITRGGTLPDSSAKTDFYNLIDTATGTVTNIGTADIAADAAIVDTQLAQITTAEKVHGSSITGTIVTTKGADIASAATTNIAGATGNVIDVTGAETITALGTVAAGALRFVRFTGAAVLTHNATSLILPTGANITCAAGDTATFESLGSGNWVCLSFQRKDGSALNSTSLTSSFKKLKIVYTTAATVTVTADEIILNNSTKISSVNFTCDVANGAGLNKLDTGTESSDAWYYIYAVDATHGFLSTSATSPTTGTVGTIYALVGAVRNTGGDFVPFKQYGREYWYTTWVTADSGYNKPNTTSIDLTTIVPSGLSEVVRGSVSGSGINGAAVSNVSGFTFGSPAANVCSCFNLTDSPQKFEFNILTENTIYWTASNSSTAVCYVYVSGFEITSLT